MPADELGCLGRATGEAAVRTGRVQTKGAGLFMGWGGMGPGSPRRATEGRAACV